MCGMIAYQATISGANLILLGAIRMADRRGRAACERGPGHAAYRHVRACRLIEHDPDPKGRVSAKWRPVFPRDKREAFARRSCSSKKITTLTLRSQFAVLPVL